MGDRAPVDMVLVEFDGDHFHGEIIAALESLAAAGTIRVLDALLVTRDGDGTVRWRGVDESQDDPLRTVVGEPVRLLAESDALVIAEDLEPDSSVGVLLFEHTWAGGLTAAVRGAHGRMLDWARVPAAAIDELVGQGV